jgi:hypothetical protein
VPIHGIKVRFGKDAPKRFRLEPGHREVEVKQDGTTTTVRLPALEIHAMLVGEELP